MHANWREGEEETDDGTERDENGESRWVIEHGDDDGGNELDELTGIRAAIDSLTVPLSIGLDPSVQYCPVTSLSY